MQEKAFRVMTMVYIVSLGAVLGLWFIWGSGSPKYFSFGR